LVSGGALAEDGAPVVAAGETKRIRSGCRACGKCECGVIVVIQDGKVVRVEGDETGAPQSNGNCCSKSQASVQAAYHPDRLRYPLKRTKPKGEDPGWERISWDEASEIVANAIGQIQEKYGQDAMMCMTGTSRVWGSCASAFGSVLNTPNRYSAGQICKGPRNLSGTLTDFFGSFWNENEDLIPNRVYVQWGTECAYSNYDSSCRTMVEVATHAAKHILIDPRITPLGKEADIWLPLRPGTDGAMAMCWSKIVVDNKLYDDLFVKRWTNAPYLVCEDIEPTGGYILEGESATNIKTRLLKESDLVEGGSVYRYIVYDNINSRFTYYDVETCEWEDEPYESVKPTTGIEIAGGFLPDPSQFNPPKDPAIYGEFEVRLKDGRTAKVRPVWEHYIDRLEPFTSERTAEICGVPAGDIEEACKLWATRIDPRMPNGGLHYQLATDQTGNCIQTIRTLNILDDICGCLDMPSCGRGPTAGNVSATPVILRPVGGPARPTVPNFDARKTIIGGDKYPLTRWFSNWADATSLWDAALTGEPYKLHGCVSCTGNFMSQTNPQQGWEALMGMEFFLMSDLWHVPQACLADVLVPSATWLEMDYPRLSQGPSGGQGATCMAVEPPGEAKNENEIQIWIAKTMNYPFNQRDPDNPWPDHATYLDTMVASFRKKDGNPYTWEEYKADFQENGWWRVKELTPERWGTYRRYEMGQLHTPAGFGIRPLTDTLPGTWTPTRKVEIWSTIIETYVDDWKRFVLPDYEEPYKSPVTTPDLFKEYPFILTTGSRNPTYFHSEHRQLPWCRELWPTPRVELNPSDAEQLGVKQGDWVWIENENGKVRQTVDVYYGIKRGVANANHTWWYPELSEPGKGWELSSINNLVYPYDCDPLCGATALRAYLCKIYKATPENCPGGEVVPADSKGNKIIVAADDPRLLGWLPDYEGRVTT
jgi:anaerobic selenocysteine-containing dehydrogenase